MSKFKIFLVTLLLLLFVGATLCLDVVLPKPQNSTENATNSTYENSQPENDTSDLTEAKNTKSENGIKPENGDSENTVKSDNNSTSEEATKLVEAPVFVAPLSNETKKTEQAEVDILPAGYYRDVAPMVDGKPVKVSVSVIILNIKLSPGSSQTFDADIFFHNYWSDHRLQRPTNERSIAQRINLSDKEESSLPQYKLSDSWKRKLWVPDTYFRNAVAGGVSNILTPTHYYTITNYTEVFMAVRLSLKLSCEMDFSKFPFDTQTCFFNLSMTSEDANTVVLDWYSFRVGSHVDKTEFEIIRTDHKTCSKYLDIGVFSCLYGEIEFRRNIGNYMIKRIIPSFIIVVITFMGFWIPTSVAPARTSLPITALLALITQQIQSDLTVSYVYALQVWNIVCIIFVFANLFEFSIALFYMHMRDKKKQRKANRDKNNNKGKNKNQNRNRINNNNNNRRYRNGVVIEMVAMLEKNENKKEVDEEEEEEVEVEVDDKKNQSLRDLKWSEFKAEWAKVFKGTTRHSSADIISRYVFPTSFFLFTVFFFIWVSL